MNKTRITNTKLKPENSKKSVWIQAKSCLKKKKKKKEGNAVIVPNKIKQIFSSYTGFDQVESSKLLQNAFNNTEHPQPKINK